MKLYGLIGYPLSHSFSAIYFKNKFANEQIPDCDYRLFPIPDISELIPILNENTNLCGFNVTIPYKKEIFQLLTHVDPVAAEVGAVNTVKVIRKGTNMELHGFNTDILGFEQSLKPLLSGRNKALVLGTGGAAMAVIFVLKRLQIEYFSVSRNPSDKAIGYSDLTRELLDDYAIIINTTPLGMHPNTENAPPIPYQWLNFGHLLYDLVYNPEVTRFMKNGLEQGCQVKNGLEMLQIQAEEAWRIFSL
jgi:shikimate dehydrogenase